MRQNQKGSAMIIVLCVLSVVIILGLSMAAISGSGRSATVKNQHNQQAYYTARSVLDSVVLMLQTEGDADNIAKGLHDEPKDGVVLTAKGSLEGMGSYTVTLSLTDKVEYITVLEPVMDDKGEQKTDDKGKLLYDEKQVVSRLPLKITVQSQYKDSAAMVSAFIDGTPVLGNAPTGGKDVDPEKPDKPGEISGAIDPAIKGLFEYAVGVRGSIANLKGVKIEDGDLYIGGAAANLGHFEVEGNIYIGGAAVGLNQFDVKDNLYCGGALTILQSKIDGAIYAGGPVGVSGNVTAEQGIHDQIAGWSLPAKPPNTLTNWKPPVEPEKLGTTVDASKGPVYLWTDAKTIDHLTIKGDYPVYIQVRSTSLHISTDKKNAIKGADDTQVFYLCEDSVKKITIGPTKGNGEGDFDGYIYAPNATITIAKNIDIEGALNASSLAATDPANIKIEYEPPTDTHTDGTVPPLPDDGDDGDDGESGGGSGGDDDDDDDEETKPDDPDDPDDTAGKVVEKYQWPVTGYQGGAV